MPLTNQRITSSPPERLRLPGYAGKAFFARPTWTIKPGSEFLIEAVDIAVVTPDHHIEVLNRPRSPGFASVLADWFFTAAHSELPEANLGAFRDGDAGLSIDCEDSDDLRIYLHVTFEMDEEFWPTSFHIESLWCARVSLLQAATDLDLAFGYTPREQA